MKTLRGSLDCHAHVETWDLDRARPSMAKMLRRAIFDAELSIADVARWSGLDGGRLGAAVNGALELTIPEFRTVSAALGLSLDELVDEWPARFPAVLGRNWRKLPYSGAPTTMRVLAEVCRDAAMIDSLERKLGVPLRVPPWIAEGRSLDPNGRAHFIRERAGLGDAPIPSVRSFLTSLGIRVIRVDDALQSMLIRSPVQVVGVPAVATGTLATFRHALAVVFSQLLFGPWEHRQTVRASERGAMTSEVHVAFADELLVPGRVLKHPSRTDIASLALTYGAPAIAIARRVLIAHDAGAFPEPDEERLRRGAFAEDAAALGLPALHDVVVCSVGRALSGSRITLRRARQLLGIPASQPLPFAFLGEAARPLIEEELVAIRAVHSHLAAKMLPYVATRIERAATGAIRVHVGDQRGATIEHGHVDVDPSGRILTEHLDRRT
ncbi:MAG: hypothetical protein KF795_22845 [Labilithrix sp.]|nr:hypothetical protein [Labilithrix sp.]